VGNIRDQILVANEVIFRMEATQDQRVLSQAETELRRALKKWLLGLASLERTIVRQHAHVHLLREGDAAMQFFRIKAAKRKRRNHIYRLQVGDSIKTEQGGLEDLATAFFTELLGRPQPRAHELALEAMGLAPVDLSSLDAQFSEEEIWATVKSLALNKSPGPYSFMWDFFRCCWGTIKVDVVVVVRSVFLGTDQHFEHLNTALLTLLPKVEGAVELKQFRPISLVHSFAKLVAKLLAMRLAPRMPELVRCN
jgi:mannosylglycoprotein endo-beta-mannosidase